MHANAPRHTFKAKAGLGQGQQQRLPPGLGVCRSDCRRRRAGPRPRPRPARAGGGVAGELRGSAAGLGADDLARAGGGAEDALLLQGAQGSGSQRYPQSSSGCTAVAEFRR